MSEKVLFRKVFVDNLKYYFDDKKVEGYVYLTSDQEMPKADEYIEDYLHILKADGVLTNSDKTYYLLVDRSEYESDDLAELEKHLFDWAEDEYHNGNYEIVDVEPKDENKYVKVRFGLYNDDNDPVYDGWYKPQDGRWNGWLQPYVDEKTYKQIYNDIKPSEQEMQSYDEDEREYWDDIKNQKPNKDGYYDVAHGICWCSEED